MKRALCLMFLNACGSDLAISDGKQGTSTQGTSPSTSQVSFDLQGFYVDVCSPDPINKVCMNRCVKHPELSAWCDVYDTYCKNKTLEVCEYWNKINE